MNDVNPIFEFETDFAGTLRCIPFCIRYLLDEVGIKLSLKQWNRFTNEERHHLVDITGSGPQSRAAFTERLAELMRSHDAGDLERLAPVAATEWADDMPIPARVVSYARGLEIEPPSPAGWAGLSPLQRFALFKLTRPNHKNENFIPAMREFGLLDKKPV